MVKLDVGNSLSYTGGLKKTRRAQKRRSEETKPENAKESVRNEVVGKEMRGTTHAESPKELSQSFNFSAVRGMIIDGMVEFQLDSPVSDFGRSIAGIHLLRSNCCSHGGLNFSFATFQFLFT